jgi:hypothetical protein
MKTTDLFKINRSSSRLNESFSKTFGKKINLENFDLHQLQDARNKLRTQISQVRNESGFNENLENDAYTKAQWMLDAINAEISERQEFVADPIIDDNGVEESRMAEVDQIINDLLDGELDPYDVMNKPQGPEQEYAAQMLQDMYDDIVIDTGLHPDDDFEKILDMVMDRLEDDYGHSADREPSGDFKQGESAPPGAKAERMVKHIKKGYANDGKVTDKEKSIAYATAWKQHNKDKNEDMNTTEAYINNAKDAINLLADLRKQSKMAELGQGDPVRPNQLVNDLWDVMQWIENNMKESVETESVNTGEDMTKLQEGEIQQASAIVTAKTMVDRVGRWIEELSGMENDTLLQLGDSIRDEMGQEQAKGFISAVAPAIQQALENLKTTREALASGVRTLTGEEQSAGMLGADPAVPGGEMGPTEPDAMNTEPDMGAEDDAFAAAEPAAGGAEAAGREQRESIQFQNRLLKMLAG